MIDVLLVAALVLFGAIIRLPLFTANLARFEEGMPHGDMSGVLEKISTNRNRLWPNDH